MLLQEFSVLEKQPTLLSSQLFYRNSVADLTLNRVMLFWKRVDMSRRHARSFLCVSKDAKNTFLLLNDIIVARETEEGGQKNKQGGKKEKVPLHSYGFTVSYADRTKHHRWRCKALMFHCKDKSQCQQWVQTINDQLSLLCSRPKRLLVYINPYSGKRLGKRIYEQRVAPLFAQASISTDVIVTKHANHARDHLETEADVEQYDGVVCVGGDGMFSEIIHSLLYRTQRVSGVDHHQYDQDLVPCDLRVGIIPAGSTDCICYATTGTNDPVTSALHIVLGDSQPIDVSSVHHNNTFLRYSTSLLGYGFYGDMLMDSERKRWMGPARYDLSGVKMFLNHHYYKGTVSFLPAEGNLEFPKDKMGCRSPCHICKTSVNRLSLSGDQVCEMAKEKSDREMSDDGAWHVIRGTFLAINAVCISCACPRSPGGLSPSAHLADGTMDLILVHRASRLDFLRHLIRHTNKDDQFNLSFVEVHRVRQFRFAPEQSDVTSEAELSECSRKIGTAQVGSAPTGPGTSHSSWSCDGEILPQAAIQVSVHCQLVKLFARGIEWGSSSTHSHCL